MTKDSEKRERDSRECWNSILLGVLNIVLVQEEGQKKNTIIVGCSHFSRMIAFLRFSNKKKAICNFSISGCSFCRPEIFFRIMFCLNSIWKASPRCFGAPFSNANIALSSTTWYWIVSCKLKSLLEREVFFALLYFNISWLFVFLWKGIKKGKETGIVREAKGVGVFKFLHYISHSPI